MFTLKYFSLLGILLEIYRTFINSPLRGFIRKTTIWCVEEIFGVQRKYFEIFGV